MFTFSASSIRRSSTGSLALAMLASVAACHSTDSTSPALVPTRVAVIAGVDSQIAVVGQPTNNVISVIVNAQDGSPVSGVVVTWNVRGGNGSVNFATSATDQYGVATTTWTLGTVAGANALQATLSGGEAVTIAATAVPGAPAALNIVSGNNQSVAEDSTTAPFVVSVADQYGNMISGLNITWTSSAGTLSAAMDATDASGEATDVLTTDDTDANYVVTASLGNLAAVFTVTAQTPPTPLIRR